MSTGKITTNAFAGTNLWANLILLIGSIFGGISDTDAGLITAAGTGIVGAFFAIRNWVKTAHFSLGKSWVKDPNNWAYVTAIITGLVPVAATLVEPLRSLANALVDGNWGSAITGAVTLISIIFYTFFKKPTAAAG